MGEKTKLSIQVLFASIFVMLLTVLLFTNNFVMSKPEEPELAEFGDDLGDGTYVGTSEGFSGPIEVEVTIKDNKITDIVILEHSETEDISDPAFEEIIPAIIEENSTDIDAVTGVTITSNAIRSAVNNALGEEEEVEVEEQEAVYNDGTYTGISKIEEESIKVEVIIEDGKILEINTLDLEESDLTSIELAEGLNKATQDALDSAVDIDLADLVLDGPFEDGTYLGIGKGAFGPIEVEVVVEDGEIEAIDVLKNSETEEFAAPAFEEIPNDIIESNSTEVDIVSGATATSEGLIQAIYNALKDAQQ